METVAEIQRKIFKGVIILSSLVSVFGFIFVKKPVPFVLGVLFGTIVGILNFRLMYLSLTKAVKMLPHKAQVYGTTSYFTRYAITGAVLFVSIKRDHINVLGTILGLVAMKMVILKYELFNDKNYFKEIFKRKEEK